MPIDLKKALKTDDPKWNKLKEGYKKVETGAWNALAPVGQWTNRTAGKFGAESFWPTELGLECDKAARILRTFTTKGASVEVDESNTAGINDQNAVVPPAAPKVDANGKKIKDPHKYDSRKTQRSSARSHPRCSRRPTDSPSLLSSAPDSASLVHLAQVSCFHVFRTARGLHPRVS